MKNITVVGSGYVGISIAVLLSEKNKITILDIDPDRVDKVNNKISTVKDDLIQSYLSEKKLYLKATTSKEEAYKEAEIVIIATPTNYDEEKEYFDTATVDNSIEDAIKFSDDPTIVIKSTIPIGYTQSIQDRFNSKKIFFSPEFLREGNALKDNLFPSRIIVGTNTNIGSDFVETMKSSAHKKNIDVLFVSHREAEAIKLFANTYLAMRVSFFNELDMYSELNDLETKQIIDGLILDDRIGTHYCNPSFGYGGYCLPKDTKQLLSNFKNVPNKLITAIVESNSVRKQFLIDRIRDKKVDTVGIYKLAMKKGSDNFRASSIIDIIEGLKRIGQKIILYEPQLKDESFIGIMVETNLNRFKERSDLILTNRIDDSLVDVLEKVYTRDIYNLN